jgi:CBS-domain-containing membrane protein
VLPTNFKLISIEDSTTIFDALKVLNENHLNSVPIFDSKKNTFIGNLGYLDLVLAVAWMNAGKEIAEALVGTDISFSEYLAQEVNISTKESAATFSNASERNPWVTIEHDASVEELAKALSAPGTYRIAVQKDGAVVGMVSQSRLVEFIYEHLSEVADQAKKSIDELSLGTEPVVSTTKNVEVNAAFRKMLDHSLNALAVVDKKGRLAGCLSASDLQGKSAKAFFTGLYAPVGSYLKTSNVSRHVAGEQTPIACQPNDTLAHVLFKLSSNHIHRTFVVDKEFKPTKVVSLTDVLRVLSA